MLSRAANAAVNRKCFIRKDLERARKQKLPRFGRDGGNRADADPIARAGLEIVGDQIGDQRRGVKWAAHAQHERDERCRGAPLIAVFDS